MMTGKEGLRHFADPFQCGLQIHDRNVFRTITRAASPGSLDFCVPIRFARRTVVDQARSTAHQLTSLTRLTGLPTRYHTQTDAKTPNIRKRCPANRVSTKSVPLVAATFNDEAHDTS